MFLETLLNFQYWEVVGILLAVFFIAVVIFPELKKLPKRLEKEFHTRKFYPELIDIYSKYVVMPRGINPFGYMLSNEPIFITKRSPFYWDYKISWRLGLFFTLVIFTGAGFGYMLYSLFLLSKNQSNFTEITSFFVLSLMGLFIQSKIRKSLASMIYRLNAEVDEFLKSRSLLREDVFVPPVNKYVVSKSLFIILNLFSAIISLGMLITFYYFKI